jgi:predicted permease
MPVAVNAVVLAERFDAASGLVSKCIVWTTLASFLTLPALIVLVQ